MFRKKVMKIGVLLAFIIMLGGCGNPWDKTFSVSELKVENNYIDGEIKNKTEFAYNVEMEFELNNGNLSDSDTCSFIMRPHQTRKMHCISMDHEDYEVKLSNIEFEKMDIPELKDGKVDATAVEYYFEEIYNEHIYNVIYFTLLDSRFSKEYPFISSAEYLRDDAELILTANFSDNDNNAYYISEKFDIGTNNMEYVSIMIFTNDASEFETIRYLISKFKAFKNITYGDIRGTLGKENTPELSCYNIENKWCVSVNQDIENGSAYYFISRE